MIDMNYRRVGRSRIKRAGSMTSVVSGCLLIAAFVLPFAFVSEARFVPPGWQEQVVPEPFEVTARHRMLADSARYAEAELDALADTESIESDVADVARQERELREAFAALTVAEYVRPDRFARLRDLAILRQQRLDEILERTSRRLERLSQLRTEWARREQLWAQWRNELADDPQFPAVSREFGLASELIDAVQTRIEEVFPVILSLQREAERLRADIRQIIEGVAAVREGRREALLRRDEPFLLSWAWLTAMGPEMWIDWEPGVIFREVAFAGFMAHNGGMLLMHFLMAVGVFAFARALRRRVHAEGTWSGMLHYPRMTGIFVSTAFFVRSYAFAPPIWDVLMWTLLSVSVAVLAGRLVTARPIRLLVYFFAVFYPVFLLLEAVQVPAPLFRLILASIAALGAAWFTYCLLRVDPNAENAAAVRWTLGVAIAIWAVVFVVEVLGYYLLARWILHATLISALVIFVVGFLIAFARGAIRALLRLEATGRLRFLRNVAIPLAERLVRLLQVALIVVAGLTLLDTWEVIVSPVQAWRSMVGVGFTVAGIEITLERVLIATLAVYMAFLASWVVRAFLETEMAPRWNVDASVTNSIVVLARYTLIAIGVVFALGVLGVELQNFAIIAGALGIGIGFGLQNIVNNFVSGLILLFERPVRVGDTVVIDGDWGTIKKIGLRSTIVVTFDRSEVIVPNADLVSEKVTNWTLTNPVARVIIPIGVAYGSDIKKVLEILRASAFAHPSVLSDPEPMVLFREFGDSSLNFELRVWVGQVTFRLEAMSVLLTEIERRLRDADIEIPFPQRDLHLRSIDPALAEAWSSSVRVPSGEKTEDDSTKPDGR